jgi:triacylglycerol esterase/lipase EstA (alpha/beta hydrolase family)
MRRLILAILVMALIGSVAAAPASAGLPVVYNGALGWADVSATAMPPGATELGARFGCRPLAEHPRPVILVHGTFADMSDNWQALSPLLANNGYCVYAFNYGSYDNEGARGIYGTGEIAHSAYELSTFVNSVLAQTGASQVDIVGYSQGGMMPRYYLKNFSGAAQKVHTLVALAPSNHGADVAELDSLVEQYFNLWPPPPCLACAEQNTGSAFLTSLNAGGETVPGVDYTVIMSEYDTVVTTASAELKGANVTNIVLQSECALDHGEHLSMPYDHIADRDVLNALDPATGISALCTLVEPFRGG